MSRQELLLGTAPSGIGGDTPRSANIKINAMTLELYNKQAALGTASTKVAQTAYKAKTGEVLVADFNGLGMMAILEGTIYATGVPTDLFGTGDCSGYCSGGALGIPGTTSSTTGILYSRMHWASTAGGLGNMQEWISGPLRYTRTPASAGAWAPWQQSGAQLVGPIAQSVVERGSNANGEYMRLIDGTQFCWCVSTGYTANAAKEGTFPMTFLSAATTVVTVSVTPSGTVDLNFTAWPSAAGKWSFISSMGNAQNQIKIMAIGRWK